MATVIRLSEHGGPERLVATEQPAGAPGEGELLVRQTAIGVNFHDIYVREGSYRTLPLPGVPGIEAVGAVEQVGPGVRDFAPGDRIGYITGAYGAYASARVLAAPLAIRLPDWLDDVAAASILLKGMTTAVLATRMRAIRPGDWVLVHAAAGGVGQMLTAWLASLGARVIGTVSSAAKQAIALEAGAEAVLVGDRSRLREQVLEVTGGAGASIVYDSIGKDTFDQSLASLDFLGTLVGFGQSSGAPEPLAMSRLAERSITVTRPIIFHYCRDPQQCRAIAATLFEAIRQGVVAPSTYASFPLKEAAAAHRMLESREATGAIVLRTGHAA